MPSVPKRSSLINKGKTAASLWQELKSFPAFLKGEENVSAHGTDQMFGYYLFILGDRIVDMAQLPAVVNVTGLYPIVTQSSQVKAEHNCEWVSM